jgi:hypothetical protein
MAGSDRAGVVGESGMPAMGVADAMLCTTDSQKSTEKDRAASTDERSVPQAIETHPVADPPLAPIEVSGPRAAIEKRRKNTGALRGASDRAPQGRRSVRSVRAPGGGGRAGESAAEISGSTARHAVVRPSSSEDPGGDNVRTSVCVVDFLDETMSGSDFEYVLSRLSFAGGGMTTVKLDRQAARYLLDSVRIRRGRAAA